MEIYHTFERLPETRQAVYQLIDIADDTVQKLITQGKGKFDVPLSSFLSQSPIFSRKDVLAPLGTVVAKKVFKALERLLPLNSASPLP